MSITGAVAAGLAGGALMGAGARKGAEQEAEALKALVPYYGALTKAQYGAMSPYMQAGKGALTAGMQMLANPINSQVALSTYYASPEYAMQQDAANYATMAAAEATGSTGNTATANTLAAQATQLGQNYLASLNKQRQAQLQTLGNVSEQGMRATTTMGEWASRNLNQATGLLAGAAGLEGQAAAAPFMSAGRAMYMMPLYSGFASRASATPKSVGSTPNALYYKYV
ncbi:hypothetical protein [Yokenella regensburgei]|uniref:hypothetical protein n=1 Tax=Yokenella regensburgei TaxID=158877 RepID=UPI0031D75680